MCFVEGVHVHVQVVLGVESSVFLSLEGAGSCKADGVSSAEGDVTIYHSITQRPYFIRTTHQNILKQEGTELPVQ